MSIKTAQDRLNNAAIVIGSMLLDGPDPKHAEAHELEAACVAYVEAIRASFDADQSATNAHLHTTATDRMAVHRELLRLDGGGQ